MNLIYRPVGAFEMLKDYYWDVTIADKCWRCCFSFLSSNCFHYWRSCVSERECEWSSRKKCFRSRIEVLKRPGTDHLAVFRGVWCHLALITINLWVSSLINKNRRVRIVKCDEKQIYDVNRRWWIIFWFIVTVLSLNEKTAAHRVMLIDYKKIFSGGVL